MTLGDFLRAIAEDPLPATVYFLALPLLALLAGWITGKEAPLSPWKYFFSLLVYAACIPGIFSACLSVYLFLFQRGGSIFNVNLVTQVVPILSMILTLSIIRRHIPFSAIPGFGRLSGLMLGLGVIFFLMYLLDRTRIIAFVYLPVQYLLLIVLACLVVLHYSFRQLVR
jgi:hypothetical protein